MPLTTLTATAAYSSRSTASGVGSKAIAKKIAATWTTVLALPDQLAAITTPWPVAAIRVAVTANSRAMITIEIHAATRSSETSAMSEATISSLSATGSHSLQEVRSGEHT